MANETEVNPAPLKKDVATPATTPVAAKPAEIVSKFPEAAPITPAKTAASFPPGGPVAPPAPVKEAPVSAVAAPTPAPTPTAAPAPKVVAKRAPVKRPRKIAAKSTSPKVVAAPKVARAPKAPKAAKVAKAPRAVKAAKAPRVKDIRSKTPQVARKADAVKVLKPVIKSATEPLLEASQLFEKQMKKLQKMWSFEAIDTGDIHVANAELREVVESTQQAAVEGIRAMNKEMEQFIQHSVDENLAAVGQLMGAKSLPELFEVQYKLAQDRLQACVEQGEKFKSIANKTAVTALAPLNDNLTQAVSGFSKFKFF